MWLPRSLILQIFFITYEDPNNTDPEGVRLAELYWNTYIEAGRRADLLLLNKNPLEDIRNTRSIHAVVANGKYPDPVQLDRILQSIKEANNESRTVSVDEYID
jgi:hypothetical protein